MQKLENCPGSFYQQRRVNIEHMGVGGRLLILRHAPCNCNTGCRRVTLWHPRPQGIETGDDWTVKAIARLRWGDGCGGPEAEVDWKHGVILDLSGCYDEVELEIIEATGDSVPDEDNPLTYGVLSACCGAGAARGCATRTTARLFIAAGQTVLVPIPPFAYAVQFAPANPPAFFTADTTLGQLGSGNQLAALLGFMTGATFNDCWALVNGAESVLITNGAADTIETEVVFLIGL